MVLAVVGGELRGGKKAFASLVERLPALKSIALS